ncbi:MAG: hypothetical protein WKF75_21095 [Singulisphaera sp.]
MSALADEGESSAPALAAMPVQAAQTVGLEEPSPSSRSDFSSRTHQPAGELGAPLGELEHGEVGGSCRHLVD